MSGFCLIRTAVAEQRNREESIAISRLKVLGFSGLTIKRRSTFTVVLFGKINGAELEFSEDRNSDFAFCPGALIYNGKSGQNAASQILEDFDGTPKILDKCVGNFSLLIFKHGLLHILNNKLGSFFLFHDSLMNIVSNSFLCLCNLLPRLTFHPHNLFEFVGKGYVSGDETPFEECHSLGPGAHLVFDAKKMIDQSAPPLLPEPFGGSFDEALDVAIELLRQKFTKIVAAYGDNITCALSGGFDSRLMLALLLEQGVRPALFVYGRHNDPDVLVATAICEGEGFQLRHVNKDEIKPPTPDELTQVARLNFQSGDGYFWSGIFNNGAELNERSVRAHHALILNGGGGEILRVFFQLLNKPYTVKQFAQAYFLDIDDRGFSSEFSRSEFIENIGIKVGHVPGCDQQNLDRHIIEWLYPMFRCRAFFGRYESIYNWNGASIVPFFDADVATLGAGLPIEWKRSGRFEALIISKIAPRLAAYRSTYGASFSGPVSKKRLAMDLLSSARPPELRHWIWRLKKTLQGHSDTHPLLAQPYVDAVFKDRDYVMKKYFNLNSVRNPDYLDRVYTLEYLAREFSGKLSVA